MCEYLHSTIIAGANAILPARTVGNDHTPKLPKDLETLLQHYHFLNRVLHSIRLWRKHPHTFSPSHDRKWSIYLVRLNNIYCLYKSIFSPIPVLPMTLSSCRTDNFQQIFATLSYTSKLLRGLHLLKEKEFQDFSIKSHIESRNHNFDTDISSFINSALFRSHRRIILDRVFIDHPTTPQLLTNPKDISDAVVDHFQNTVPIKFTPPSHISALPDRWCSEYSPMDSVSPDIYGSLLSPPSLEEWLTTVASMPNGKASDLWRQAMVFPIPIGDLFYNRLSSILATHNVLTGGNFAGLPGGTCRDLIITLESIIYDANYNNSPLWILSQDISKVFDSVNLTMLKFALERIGLPASSIMLILSLFMNRSNQVFTAHGDTSLYRVYISIDQGEVVFPLLWVIYIDPLLSVLKKEMLDPYILRSLTLLLTILDDASNLAINNLVFMDDSTLISSTKARLEYMLSITEEFYALNNTSANHQKYVLLPLTTTSTISPFNIKGSCDFIRKQIAGECNLFAAILCPAKLSVKQVIYLYNTVLIPKLEYRMQVTHFSEKDCYTATQLIHSLIKQKANFSRSLSNPLLYLSQALELTNLFSHLIQCHVTNLFLMANSSTLFIQHLFVYRLMLIQFQFLIPISPLMVDDWSLWSNMNAFKCDYIACTLASLISTPFQLQHASFNSISPDLTLPGHTPLYSCISPQIFKACLKVL
ncbi:hypothetical protein RclHR1_13730006 [Rhizophagus clarus]|uniref:Reverse transcriptase domain-containing protein n=1 Tax=Rhizophagus clarus TaxID=94130 RepID=A0A2Z6R3D3_9GLOM|nr:hypothetical protein RclHR1_13730006 [Rhizophagus clarus]